MKKKPEIAFEVTVQVPVSVISEINNAISCMLEDDYPYIVISNGVNQNPKYQAALKSAIYKHLQNYADGINEEDVIYDLPLEKIFKAEIKAAKKKELEEEAREKAEDKAAQKANAAEEAKLKKEGRTLVVPLKDSKRAETLLREAGIKVKLL